MAIAIVWLASGDYPALAQAMEARGFVRWIIGSEPARLSRGVYWMAEPTVASEILELVKAAAAEAGEPTAKIVVTSGESRWRGLPPIEGE